MFSLDTIDQLINLNIQIEGLLRLLRTRQNPDAERLLANLVNDFNQLVEQMSVGSITPTPAHVPESVPSTVSADYLTDSVLQIMPDDQPVSIVVTAEPVSEDTVATVPVSDDKVKAIDSTPVTNNHGIDTFNPQPSQNAVTETTIGDQCDQPRLADKVARQEAQDLSRAFTINDRFRFIRSIFGSNSQKFDHAIARLSGLTDNKQALAYLYDEMHLDPADPDVEAFVAIIANHFD